MKHIKIKRMRENKCIFTGKYMESTVTRDTSYDLPDKEYYVAREWAGKLYVDSEKTVIKGSHIRGTIDQILTSPTLGYKVSRIESSKEAKIKFEVISYGSLNDKQRKTLTKVVKAATRE